MRILNYKGCNGSIISFCFGAMLLISCGKENKQALVEGTVRDATTNEIIINADVGLFEKSRDIITGYGGVQIDAGISDVNGEFNFAFNPTENNTYYVQAVKENYWNNQASNITFISDLGEENNLEVMLYPEGYLKVHIKDEFPFFENSKFRVNIFGGSIQLNGYQLDSVFEGLIYGNLEFELFCVVEDLAIDSNYIYSYTFNCPAFDTSYFEILY